MTAATQATLAYMQYQQDCARGRVLRRPEVQHRTGLSRSGIYAQMALGQFPKPLKLTAKAVGWTESSISDWIAERETASQAAQPTTGVAQ